MAGTRIQGFTTALTDIDTSPQEYLGAIRMDYNIDYKYVMFSGTNAVAVGDALCYVLTDTTLHTVDAANSAVGAGVAVAVHPSGSTTYGWIQIRGVVTLSTVPSGTLAVGGAVSAQGGALRAFAMVAAATSPPIGSLITATSPYIVQLDCKN